MEFYGFKYVLIFMACILVMVALFVGLIWILEPFILSGPVVMPAGPLP